MSAGQKQCGGVLWTNRWLITADHCIPFSVEPSDVVVTLGGDLENPVDVQVAKQIVRYPLNTATFRARDIVLLELEQGMLVNGQRAGYFMNVYPLWKLQELLGKDLKCFGWALDSTLGSPRFVRQRPFWIDSVTYTLNEFDAGDQVFLGSNTSTIMPVDEGGSCFTTYYGLERQVVMMLGPGRGINLSEARVLEWLFSRITKAESTSMPGVSNNVASVVTPSGVELYWVSPNGALMMSDWPPDSPPDVLAGEGTFLPLRPAAEWLGTSRLLVAVKADGELSYAIFGDAVVQSPPEQTSLTLQPLGLEASTTNSGVSLAKLNAYDVRLFIRGENDELRMTSFNGELWSPWVDLGEELGSAPSAVAWSDQRIDVVARTYDNDLIQRHFDAKTSLWSAWESRLTQVRGAPVVTSWAPGRLDLFIKAQDGGLFHYSYDRSWFWFTHNLKTSTDLDDEPTAFSPIPGRLSFLDPGMNSVRETAVYPE